MEKKNTHQELKPENLTALDPSKGIQAAKDLIARKNQDGTVIIMKLDESTHFFKIDGIAAEVWANLAQRSTMGELLQAVKNKHPKHHAELDVDIPKFVLELLNKNLLTYC